MGKLRILAAGTSPQAQAQARGQLFEKLMANVLRHHGYTLDTRPNVNYAGMEIDIEGRASIAGIPLYAECKCYGTDVDAPKVQAFYGKYMARWHKDKRCHGIFVALPGVNSHAKGFYKDHCESNLEATVRLLEEEQVLEAIFQNQDVLRGDAISKLIPKTKGTPGDQLLLYTDRGLFWVQYMIPPGGAIPNGVATFTSSGGPVSDRATLDYLTQLCPELGDFERLMFSNDGMPQSISVHQDEEQIVEVRGSSACFEYQFPAAPEYFVGREAVLAELDSFAENVINQQTSCRGILFEAHSGWGKSSVVLASVARLREMGHFALAIDCRSAASSQFILRVIEYTVSWLRNTGYPISEDPTPTAITGFEGAVKTVLDLAQLLEREQKVLFIFLDQFENLFFLHDALRQIRNFFLKVCDAGSNVVLGFSWKTDLIGSTSDFPYQLREDITSSSKRIPLGTFSEVETTALLGKLSEELHSPLRKDLEFFLSEFSQGYPWLLKKLCAHVKIQREKGVQQSNIANSLLNVEELFQEDLRGLSPEQHETLKRIAKVAPIGWQELGEEFKPEVVQSLVDTRLVVRIGTKYDVYWDIFRDYLNTGHVPVQENYVLRVQVSSVLKGTMLLAKAGGQLRASELREKARLSEKSYYNVVRDMRLLGIATMADGRVSLQVDLSTETKDFKDSLRVHLRDRLPRNRLVSRLMEALEAGTYLTTDRVSGLLAEWCPYISATTTTWRMYARILAGWIDFADLAIFDATYGILEPYRPGTEVRKRDLSVLLPKRRGGMAIPCIQYSPVEKIAIRIVQAIQQESGAIDLAGFKKSTISKALRTLEDLGFIIRKPQSIAMQPRGHKFASNPEKRLALFAEGALNMTSFALFVEILRAYESEGLSLSELGLKLKDRLGARWKDGTAETNAKIMLDWARHTRLAPRVFDTRGSGSGRNRRNGAGQLPLFSYIDES